MTKLGHFDAQNLRRRSNIHELHQRGLSNEDIAANLGLAIKYVRYWLARPKPRLRRLSNDIEWREMAACSHEDTRVFFPTTQGRGSVKLKEQAMGICAGCPVIAECRRSALEYYETVGVWGGEDFSQYRYRYDESTGDVYVEIGGNGASLQKVS